VTEKSLPYLLAWLAHVQVVTLYALCRVEDDMGWLMTEGLLTTTAAKAVAPAVRGLCAQLALNYK
jgi:hypothetical protein